MTDTNPKRLENESFEDYKKRRKENNDACRKHLKGRTIWDSSDEDMSTVIDETKIDWD